MAGPPTTGSTSALNRDWLGVKVIADHEWRTGFLWWNGTVEWEEDAVFHLEPGIEDGLRESAEQPERGDRVPFLDQFRHREVDSLS